MLSLLHNGDQLIDVGANIGWYTVSAARRVTATGNVFAFEPDATNFSLLSANIKEGGLSWVSAERVALGRATGSAVMRHSNDNLGDHRVRAFEAHEAGVTVTGSVPVLALDKYLAQSAAFDLGRLRIIKIDVQGFESEVLKGARDLFSRLPTRTLCFIEFDPLLLHDCSPDACNCLISILSSLGREILALTRPIWRLTKFTIKELQEAANPGAERAFDLIIAHSDSLSDLRGALPIIPRLLSSAALWASPVSTRAVLS